MLRRVRGDKKDEREEEDRMRGRGLLEKDKQNTRNRRLPQSKRETRRGKKQQKETREKKLKKLDRRLTTYDEKESNKFSLRHQKDILPLYVQLNRLLGMLFPGEEKKKKKHGNEEKVRKHKERLCPSLSSSSFSSLPSSRSSSSRPWGSQKEK